MATSVEIRRFLKPGPSLFAHADLRPDPPVRSFTHKKSPVSDAIALADDSSSSDEDEDEELADWKSYQNDGEMEIERSILDPRDEGTADRWIERNPALIRLTGKHPFNCEPPLTRLMTHGFITPVPLHYVRNHGPVPMASWDEWTVEVCGLVKRPTRFTMSQLVKDFPTRELPVTLVCAGNRRKEQNMVKQTIGFNWGAAGVSTSVWRGANLRDLLKRCGVLSRRRGALNVCFEGAEELPGGGGGGSKYGTSLRKEIAMDPSRDIIVAYMQNGEPLAPDHGFPVRMIIPGFIGGRMVKWLRRIIVTTGESQSYYHYRDNRVLPSHVDAELANEQAWWYKPEYIINELNINSVITTPCHEEILPVNSATTQIPFTLKGYAYSGHVEIQSLRKSVSSPFMNGSSKHFSVSEVKKHGSPDSAWIVVHGHVYDCTRFLKDHPGGADSILINAGTDCTEEFDAIHSDKAKAMLEDYHIGEIISTGETSGTSSSQLAPVEGSMVARSSALVFGEKIPCKFVSKTSISRDVRLFRFTLPYSDHVLGLPVGKHIHLCATIDGKLCMRAYTPTTSADEVGYFDLLIKIYFKGDHPKFPNGGLMSQHLESLPIGATLDVKGPLGQIEYMGRGNFIVHGKPKFARRLAMLAGGTGITPLYQVMRAVLKDTGDETEMYLVYANRTEEDILLREELDEWASRKRSNVKKVWYVVETGREGWKYGAGFITESVLRDHIPEGSVDTLALACGPPAMIEFAVLPGLEKMNYDVKNCVLTF